MSIQRNVMKSGGISQITWYIKVIWNLLHFFESTFPISTICGNFDIVHKWCKSGVSIQRNAIKKVRGVLCHVICFWELRCISFNRHLQCPLFLEILISCINGANRACRFEEMQWKRSGNGGHYMIYIFHFSLYFFELVYPTRSIAFLVSVHKYCKSDIPIQRNAMKNGRYRDFSVMWYPFLKLRCISHFCLSLSSVPVIISQITRPCM